MGWTKRQFIESALDEIGLSPFTYELTQQQLDAALRRLDAMMAEWNAKGIRLGFPLPSSPGSSSLDEQSGVPDAANEAIITNLATRVAPSYGKQVMQQTMMTAKSSYNTLLMLAAMPPEQAFPGTLPLGQGNKAWRDYGSPFFPSPEEPLTAGGDGILEFE